VTPDLVVRPDDPLDLDEARRLASALEDLPPGVRVHVDLSAVRDVHATGLAALACALDREGRVTVGGLTATATAEKLRACLADGYIRNPYVSVIIKEYNSKKIFVFGEVQKPGTFVYEDGMSIVQAVTIAGGFTKTAARNSTSVTRRVHGQEVKAKVSVQDIALGKAPNFTLEPGDIVYVPESLF